MNMKRKRFLMLVMAILLAASLAIVGCAPEAAPPEEEEEEAPPAEEEEEAPPAAPEEEVIEWRMVCDHPAAKSQFYAHQSLVDNINEMANGQLVIEYYPAGEICSPGEVFDYVSVGSVEAAIRWPGYDAGKNSAFDLFANMMTFYGQREYLMWFNHGGGNEVARELYAPYNIYFFPAGCMGAESGIRSSKKKIETVDDYDGMKLRISSKMAGKIVDQLGGSPLLVAHAETYEALSRGTIDGGEMGSVTDDWVAGYQEVCPYLSAPAWYQISAPMVFLVNMDAWNALPDHLQQIVEVAAQAAQQYVSGYMENDNYEHYLEWEEYGTETIKLTEEDLDRVQEMAAAAFEEEAAANPDFAKVMNSMMDYLKKASSYNDAVLGRYSQGVAQPKVWPEVD